MKENRNNNNIWGPAPFKKQEEKREKEKQGNERRRKNGLCSRTDQPHDDDGREDQLVWLVLVNCGVHNTGEVTLQRVPRVLLARDLSNHPSQQRNRVVLSHIPLQLVEGALETQKDQQDKIFFEVGVPKKRNEEGSHLPAPGDQLYH